ncbi:MAG: right-handed parallel beta-helix repeat-containing protein [Rhodospirillales bacterium]
MAALLLSTSIVTEGSMAADGTMLVCLNTYTSRLRVVAEGVACHRWETGPTALVVAPTGPSGPKTLSVDCDQGGTIAGALDAAGAGDTIEIEGTCHEVITLLPRHDEVRLVGRNGAVIDGMPPTGLAILTHVVTVRGARMVRMTGLTVRNGLDGLRVGRSASVQVENCAFSQNAGHGVAVTSNAWASLVASTVSHNDRNGVRITESSSAWLENNTVEANGENGVQVLNGASAQLVGNTIQSNAFSGVDVSGNSVAGLWGGNTIRANADFSMWRGGIGVYHNSHVTIGFSTVDDVIAENRGPGIAAGNSSSVFMNRGVVSGNLSKPMLLPRPVQLAGHGVRLNFDSFLQIEGEVRIERNDGYGIWCFDAESGANVSPPARLVGNDLGGTNCFDPR